MCVCVSAFKFVISIFVTRMLGDSFRRTCSAIQFLILGDSYLGFLFGILGDYLRFLRILEDSLGFLGILIWDSWGLFEII